MLEENSMEKNLDGREMMLDYYHLKSRQNKPINPMMVGIVEKMHDEENQHQMLIMLRSMMMESNPTITKIN